MVNICTLEQLCFLVDKGIVKGCGHCRTVFMEDGLAYAAQTGTCPYCHKKLDKVFTNNRPLKAV
ncbi:MAG: hypothetical protein HFH68_01585 [Lachnospiraceae bacterium]|nr:hypothetical protein [Lachnospiraceae bacterium]